MQDPNNNNNNGYNSNNNNNNGYNSNSNYNPYPGGNSNPYPGGNSNPYPGVDTNNNNNNPSAFDNANTNANINVNNPYIKNEENLNQKLISEDKNDIEQGQVQNEADTADQINKSMRLGFIRKVYGILALQLTMTVALCTLAFNESVKDFLANNPALFWVAFVLSIFVVIPLVCCRKVARKVPLNYVLLFAWTFLESFMIMNAIMYYDPKTVMLAGAGTAVITISLTIYACYTKTDFTFCGGLLFAMCGVMVIWSIFMMIFGFFLYSLYCAMGLILYSVYLIYDTQLIMGKFGAEFSIDDYVIAALNVYIDIIQIFLYLLQLLSR